MDIAGVDAEGGEDFGILLSDFDVRLAVGQVCGDADQARDTSGF